MSVPEITVQTSVGAIALGHEAVGIVGLGNLGMAVAVHLARSGRDVIGFRRRGGEDFVAAGGRLVASPRDVFEQTDLVFTCLPDDRALASVIEGEDGFLSSGASGRIVVDLSTTGLEFRTAIRDRLRGKGSTLVDCPVSGLPVAVEQRKGVLLASCDREEFAAVEEVLQTISDEVFYVGEFGAGTQLKFLANFLMIIHAAAAAQAVALALTSGLDARAAVDILARGAGSSYQLASRGPRMAARNYDEPRATLDQLLKDIVLISEFSSQQGLQSGLFAEGSALVEKAISMGFGDREPTALVEAVLASQVHPTEQEL